MPDIRGTLDRLKREIRELYSFVENPAYEVLILSQETEKLARENLAKSPDARDRKATVDVQKTGPSSFELVVKRPPEVQKDFKPKKKDLMPGRYFEIHGPGGRVKVTTNVAVMEKAKKQGIHVQAKYKMPDGKTSTEYSIYGAYNQPERIDGPISKKDIIDRTSQEFRAMLSYVSRLSELKLEQINVRAL